MLYKTAINLCISCVLTTFNKDNDDDDDDDDVVQASSRHADNRDRRYGTSNDLRRLLHVK